MCGGLKVSNYFFFFFLTAPSSSVTKVFYTLHAGIKYLLPHVQCLSARIALRTSNKYRSLNDLETQIIFLLKFDFFKWMILNAFQIHYIIQFSLPLLELHCIVFYLRKEEKFNTRRQLQLIISDLRSHPVGSLSGPQSETYCLSVTFVIKRGETDASAGFCRNQIVN